MAPENFKGLYSEKSDVWSYGCLLIEMVTRKQPWDGYDNYEVINMVTAQGVVPSIPPNTPIELAEVMAVCWKRSPDDRFTFDRIVAMLKKPRKLSDSDDEDDQIASLNRQLNPRTSAGGTIEPANSSHSNGSSSSSEEGDSNEHALPPPPKYESSSAEDSSSVGYASTDSSSSKQNRHIGTIYQPIFS